MSIRAWLRHYMRKPPLGGRTMLPCTCLRRLKHSLAGVVRVSSLRAVALGEDFGISFADYMPKPPFLTRVAQRTNLQSEHEADGYWRGPTAAKATMLALSDFLHYGQSA